MNANASAKGEAPSRHWQVTVQAPQVLEAGEVIPLVVPGYVQVDDVSGGVNRWSASPERLRQRGFEVPDFSALPSGRYRFEEAVEMVRAGVNHR